ncbi:MAG: hypothetical protein ABJB33_09020 [Gemmatimonadota bacterium]
MRQLFSLTLLLIAACGTGKPAAGVGERGSRANAPSVDAAATEAQELGRELFGIMDRVLSYKSSHYNVLPKDLPAMGIDSLTRATVRRLTVPDGVPTLVVAYRRIDGHAIQGCTGTNKVIEDSMLNGGAFEVNCILRSGEARAFTVGG